MTAPDDNTSTNTEHSDHSGDVARRRTPSDDAAERGAPGNLTGRSQTEVETTLARSGHDGQFGARPDAQILCFTCRETFPAASVRADRVGRVEGESDPADMSIVVPVTCPHCSTAGTLTVQYGPQASADEAAVLTAIERPADPRSPEH